MQQKTLKLHDVYIPLSELLGNSNCLV